MPHTSTEKDSESYAEHATYTEKESYKQACFPQEPSMPEHFA